MLFVYMYIGLQIIQLNAIHSVTLNFDLLTSKCFCISCHVIDPYNWHQTVHS